MEVVIDTNCLISALIKGAKSRELICLSNINFYAPEDIISETIKHRKEIISKTKMDENDFDTLIGILISKINIIPENEFRNFKDKALKLVKHKEDAPFMALALSKNIPIWSDDKDFEIQNKIKIYKTKDLISP